jgi:hypothetical protein
MSNRRTCSKFDENAISRRYDAALKGQAGPEVSPFILKEAVVKRAAVFGMVVVVVASAWTYLAAQSAPAPAPKPTFDAPVGPAPEPGPKFDRQGPGAAENRAQDRSIAPPLTPLQQRYVDLATKKARLMSEEQLQQAVNEFDHDIQELNAWSKVEESARALREVIEKHPQTRAAGTARSVIRIIEQGRPNNLDEPLSHPVRGEKFEPAPGPAPPPTDRPFAPATGGPKSPEPPAV